MSDIMELHAGLDRETPLIIGDDIRDMASLFISSSSVPTYALDDNAIVIQSEIIGIPREAYVSEIQEINFSNKYTLRCTPKTPILTISKWKPADELKIGDKILGAMYTENGITGRVFDVVHNEKSYKMIPQSMYYFIAKHQNILLPNYSPEDNSLTFICVHQ